MSHQWVQYRGGSHGPLLGSYVWKIAVDQKGRVWVESEGGIVVRTAKGWRYPSFSDLTNGEANRFWISKTNHLWITDGQRLVRDPMIVWERANPSANHLSTIKRQIEQQYPKVPPGLNAVTGPKRRIWLATNRGLLRYDGKTWKPIQGFGPKNSVNKLFVDSHSRVWIATSGTGLWCFDHGHVKTFASSAESVGELRLGQSTELVV